MVTCHPSGINLLRRAAACLGSLGIAAAAYANPTVNVSTSNQTGFYKVYGSQAGLFGGTESRGAAFGDFNGDGYDDLAIARYGIGASPATGSVQIIWGGPGLDATRLDLLNTPAGGGEYSAIIGGSTNDGFGWSIAAGDFNGDGYDDVAIGAPLYSSTPGTNIGMVHVFYGNADLKTAAAQTINLGIAGQFGSTRVQGRSGGHQLGYAVAFADINADGFDDLVMGAPGADSSRGQVYVLYGGKDKPGNPEGAGSSVNFWSGLEGTNGETIIRGGNATGAQFGYSLASGDINGDGYPDLVVGSPATANALLFGRVFTIYGQSGRLGTALGAGSEYNLSLVSLGSLGETVISISALSLGDEFGASVACGDVNGDGFDDIVIGAPKVSVGSPTPVTNVGQTHVIYGVPDKPGLATLLGSVLDIATNLSIVSRINGPFFSAETGRAVACGDVDGDGYADVIIGNPLFARESLPGGAYILSGVTVPRNQPVSLNSLAATLGLEGFEVVGPTLQDRLGASVVIGGDMQRAGRSGLALMGPNADNPFSTPGNALGIGAVILGSYADAQVSVKRRMRAGETPPVPFGGRLAPDVRAFLGFDAGASVSDLTVTRYPDSSGVIGLPTSYDDLLDVMWRVQSNRSGNPAMFVSLKYLESEMPDNGIGQDRARMRVWSAPTNAGPWSMVENAAPSAADIDRNRISVDVPVSAADQFFALVLDDTPPQVEGITRQNPTEETTNAANVTFRVEFWEAVTGVVAGNFTLSTTGGQGGASILGVTQIDPATYDVTVQTVPNADGFVRLDLTGNLAQIVDLLGNELGLPFVTGESFRVDRLAPQVTSIVRTGGAPQATAGETVSFTVAFTESVVGLGAGNFTVVTSGDQAGAAIASVTPVGLGQNYLVEVATQPGEGEISLNLGGDLGSVLDAAGNTLAAGFNATQSYLVDRKAPVITSITRSGGAPELTNTGQVHFSVLFDEPVLGVSADLFTIEATGTQVGSTISAVTGGGATWQVTVDVQEFGVGAIGLGLNLPNLGLATDLLGNALSAVIGLAETYFVDRVAPLAISSIRAGGAPESTADQVVFFDVAFSKPILAPNTGDFSLALTGDQAAPATGAQITGVTGADDLWQVEVATGFGTGSIRLDIDAGLTGITDLAGNALGASLVGDQLYLVNRTTSELVVDTASEVIDGLVGSVAALLTGRGPDGRISLPEAVAAANATPGDKIIRFDAALAGQTIELFGNDLALIGDNITIDATGLDITLTSPGGSLDIGILVEGASNRILGLNIVGFNEFGVVIEGANARDNIVQGCRIGTNANGDTGLGNSIAGIWIGFGARDNLIGGNLAGQGNVIAANGNGNPLFDGGVVISDTGATGNRVLGNIVGLGPDGAPAAGLGNFGSGILVRAGASGNIIGGAGAGEGNVISANDGPGVLITGVGTDGTELYGNRIGTDANNTREANPAAGALGNRQDGILVSAGARGSRIGGTATGRANRIWNNVGAGVRVDGTGTDEHEIRGNSITNNSEAAIALDANGNVGIAAPVITSVSGVPGAIIVSGTAAPNSAVTFYVDDADQAELFLPATGVVSDSVTGTFSRTINLSAQLGRNILATTTDVLRNTSPLSAPKQINLPPVITLKGPANLSVECGGSSTQIGATALDDIDGDLTALIVASGDTPDLSTPGVYVTTYDVTDLSGLAAASVVQTVTVADTTPPAISLNGAASLTLQCNVDTYAEPGATVLDGCAGDISNVLQIGGDTVQPTVPGTYIVTYNAQDIFGNVATTVTRTVEVVDTLAPVVTLNGPAAVTLTCGQVYAEAGATALDTCAGAITPVISGAVNPNVAGVYPLTYTATDPLGNVGSVVRTVTVVDSTPPTLSLIGPAAISIACGDTFTDPGATANDACAGDLTAAIVVTGTVNANAEGVYTLRYNVSDPSGNAATEVQRVVTVGVCAVPVAIPDAALEAALRAALIALGATPGPVLTDIDLANPAFTAFTANGAGIADLAGLEFAVNLQFLSLRNNAIADLSPLAGHPALRQLLLHGNDIVDIGPLAGIATLEELYLHFNDVDDLTPLAGLTGLRRFEAQSNAIADLTPLAGLAALTTLRLANNQIADVSPLETLTNLTVIDLSLNPITDITPLVDNTGLGAGTTINLTGAPLSQEALCSGVGALTARGATVSATGSCNTPPVITLTGPAVVNLNCGQQFTDPGAVATDAEDDDATLTAAIVVGGDTVDTGAPGVYVITYDVTDSGGLAAAQVQRTVVVAADTQPPAIALIGPAVATVQCGAAYADAGATAFDACEGDLTAQVVATGAVNTAVPGAYTITFNVSDGSGNAAAPATRTVTVVDTQAPTITRNGPAFINVQCGSPYTDAGATATDACAGNLTGQIATTGSVNTSVPGTYTLRYNVSDPAGNAATEVTRTVTVLDTQAPTITLNGAASITLACGAAFTDPGATATDACAGNLTSQIVATGNVNTAVPGVYTRRYNVSDPAGNAAAEITRTVTVLDTQAPTITLNGAASITLACGAAFTDPGATATDACAGNLTSQIVATGNVNTAVPGIYTRRYNVSDPAGNAAAEITRTVTVVDNVAPTLTLSGATLVTLACGAPFVEPGFTATDACAGNLTAQVQVDGFVDPGTPGDYTLFYRVADPAGNSTEKTRTVRVTTTGDPVITLAGPETVLVACGGSYAEPGATAVDGCGNTVPVLSDAPVAINRNRSGAYTVTYTAVDGAGNTATARRFVVVNCGTPACTVETAGRTRFCLATIRPNNIDQDGDGLAANLEACLCTSDTEIDSDGDGIPDNFEVRFPDALDPTDPTDALCDPDRDNLSNLEEFLEDGDPTDPDSPRALFWVRAPAICGAADTSGDGTMKSPWRSIGHAIAQIQARGLGGQPVRINLQPGDYCEAVTLLPNMALARGVAADPCDPAGGDPCAADPDAPGCAARVFGGVTGAAGAAVIDLTLAPDPALTPRIGQDAFLLVINNVEMRVEGCRFTGIQRDGRQAPRVHGVRAVGASDDAVIAFSSFTDLFVGVVIAGDIPVIRRNLFQDIERNAVLILARTATGPERSLGAAEDPSRGFNTFVFDRIGESVVVNLRGGTVRMENNDWNTDSPSTVSGIISGPATFEPFIAGGNAIFAGSLFCTVWAADNQQRITNATVRLEVSNFLPVTQNQNAVYGFPAVVEGVYDIDVAAPGFLPIRQRVTVLPGQFVSMTVAMPRDTGGEGEDAEEGEGEGEGEDPPPPPGGCCRNPSKDAGIPLGDGLVGAFTMGVFLGGGLMMRRRQPIPALRT